MLTYNRIAVVGSREFKNYEQLKKEVSKHYNPGDWLVSGGAIGADSMAQRLTKECGWTILVIYPLWKYLNNDGVEIFDKGAGFKRNEQIVRNSDMVLAFYQKGRYQLGGTANTTSWARKLNVPLTEFEEEA